jgi:hypothetical protein
MRLKFKEIAFVNSPKYEIAVSGINGIIVQIYVSAALKKYVSH